jgi:hypothetical protein
MSESGHSRRVRRVHVTSAYPPKLAVKVDGADRLRRAIWLDDLQWSSIKGYLPSRKRRGQRQNDDRRIISGIVHVLQSGMRWPDCPKEFGASTTIYNRWHRWSQQGLWQKIFMN